MPIWLIVHFICFTDNLCMNNSSGDEKIDDFAFLTMVIHDLKTPIIAEICALELLLKDKHPASFEHELINDILNSSKYMKNLVENLLLKYKSEKNQLTLQLELCPINVIISKSIEEIQYILRDKKQKIVFKNKTKDSTCEIDFIEIKRTINNLLTNANQYAPPKSEIEIILEETSGFFSISIINSVSNSASSIINNFTNPIEQSKNTKTVNAGLGLFICKKIMELHNGQIFQEILPNNKNKFQLILPKKL